MAESHLDQNSTDVSSTNPLMKWAGQHDPNDPDEQAFLEILAEQRKQDLEQTLREFDQEGLSS